MHRACLLAAASALALAAQAMAAVAGPSTNPAFAKSAKLLYTQNSDSTGDGVGSQNFTSGTFSSSDDLGADDFVVPKKTHWKISEVDVSGYYYNGPGPAKSENVIFYKDNQGAPGAVVKNGKITGVTGVDTNGSFAIQLPHRGLTLKPGTYWVSVIANCSYKGGCGEWAWGLTSQTNGNQPMWREPESTGRCAGWETIEYCFGYAGDLRFALRGRAK